MAKFTKQDIFILISSLGIMSFYLLSIIWLLNEMIEQTLFNRIFFGIMACISSLGISIISSYILNLAIKSK